MESISNHTNTLAGRFIPRRAKCAIHGEYDATVATIRGAEYVSDCPTCDRERADRAAREVVENMNRRRREKALEESGLPGRYFNRTFESWKPVTPEQRGALRIVKTFAADFETTMRNGASLCLWGNPGTGKTHLASAAVLAVIDKGHTARYATLADFLADIKATWGRNAEKNEADILRAYGQDLDLLVLDEVGVQFGSPAEQSLTTRLLNRRYEWLRPTIVVTNLNPTDLGNYLSERIVDRFTEGGGVSYPFTWASARRKKD